MPTGLEGVDHAAAKAPGFEQGGAVERSEVGQADGLLGVEAAVQGADDQLWAFLDWAISPEHAELWETLMAAHVAGVDEEVSNQVESLLNWWDAKFQALVSGRAAPGYTPAQLCDIAGTVVEGILLSPSGGAVSGISGKQILRATLSSLVLEPR